MPWLWTETSSQAAELGTAIPFALEIVRYFADDAAVEHIKDGLVYHVVQ